LTDLVVPTLLLDESDFDGGINSRQIMRLLRAGNHPGADVYVNGQRFRVFCPKVVASRTPLPDAALASRSIHVAMTPSRKELQLLDLAAEQNLAAEMQGKLERFRLEHYRDLCIPQLDNSGLSSRTRDLARVLATPLLGDAGLTSRLLTCLKARDEDAFLDRFGEPEWIVAATLFAFSHRPGLQVYIGNLAEEANRMLAELGETYTLTAKGVGVIARKSLRTHTTKDGRGFYVSLTASRRRAIHELARDMGISKADILDSGTLRAGYAGPPCRLCTELGLLTRRDGTILRSVILPPPGRNRKGLFEPKP